MQYVLTIGLTLIVFWSIIIIKARFDKKTYGKSVYRQSDMHEMLKIFFERDLEINKSFSSQLNKRKEDKTTKVVILEDQAYWVDNNVFYVGLTVNGIVKPETARPLDTSKLSTKDIDKLLFILDTLKGGKSNDSGGTRN